MKRYVSIYGESKTIAEWSRDPRCGVSYASLRERIGRGMDPADAMETPSNRRTKHKWREKVCQECTAKFFGHGRQYCSPRCAFLAIGRKSKQQPVEPILAEYLSAEFGATAELEYRFTQYRKWRLDLAFPALKLAIELDGYRFHNSRKAQINDMEKRNCLTEMGWVVLVYPASWVFRPSVLARIGEQIFRVAERRAEESEAIRVLTYAA